MHFEGLMEMSHPGVGGGGQNPGGGATGTATGETPCPCCCIAAAALKFGSGNPFPWFLCPSPGPNSGIRRKGKSGICGGCRQEGSSGKAILRLVLHRLTVSVRTVSKDTQHAVVSCRRL